MRYSYCLLFLFVLFMPHVHGQLYNAGLSIDNLPFDSSLKNNTIKGSFKNNIIVKNSNRTLGRKWLRGELFCISGQVTLMCILTSLPSSISNWQRGYLRNSFKNISRAFSTSPVWDHDAFYINYPGHTYSGAFYYNAVRSQNATEFQSFIYSLAQSTFFEYVIEAVAERPSKQDLIVTPLLGSVMGEVFNKLTICMRKNGFSFPEKVVVFLINPMYVFNNGYSTKKLHTVN